VQTFIKLLGNTLKLPEQVVIVSMCGFNPTSLSATEASASIGFSISSESVKHVFELFDLHNTQDKLDNDNTLRCNGPRLPINLI
jgi:hypothetical protein